MEIEDGREFKYQEMREWKGAAGLLPHGPQNKIKELLRISRTRSPFPGKGLCLSLCSAFSGQLLCKKQGFSTLKSKNTWKEPSWEEQQHKPHLSTDGIVRGRHFPHEPERI